MSYTSLVVAANKEDTIDPTNILKQVISARLKIPPSTMKIEISSNSRFGSGVSVYSVIFDGVKRRFDCIAGSGKGDIALYDGKEIISYTPSILQRVDLLSLTNDGGSLVFDPRTLGINPAYFRTHSVRTSLPTNNVESLVLVGKEIIETNSVWHIQITLGSNWNLPSWYKHYVWIDNQFRVRKYIENGVEALSFYDEKIVKDLPYKVISTPRNEEWRTELIIREFKNLKKSPDDSIWTLNGMNIPKGTEVVDERIRLRLGYWDGTKIVKSFTELNAKKSKPVSIWILVPAVLLLFLIPLCIYVLKRVKNKT